MSQQSNIDRDGQVKPTHRVELGSLPNDADLAIVPISAAGVLSELAKSVIIDYGYSTKDISRGGVTCSRKRLA